VKKALVVLMLVVMSEAWAVRPFVTDDARIIDVRQMEVETWTEFGRGWGHTTLGQHAMAGYTFNDWIELIAGFGIGQDLSDGQFTIANPVIQPKLLLWQAYDDGFPGLALGLGTTLPLGTGAYYDDALGYYAIAMITTRQFHDWLQVHFNLGRTFARASGEKTEGRNYWGIGLDVGVYKIDYRYILEAYAGDPFEALGPEIAFQTGFRWLKSDFINFDLTFGAQPELSQTRMRTGRWEYWAQVGVRFLFDTFRGEMGPGLYEGAKGAFNPRAGFASKPQPQFSGSAN
jgi:hypothetical protein